MTKLEQAARQALEALENTPIEYDFHGNPMDVEFGQQLYKAITALREALDHSADAGNMVSDHIAASGKVIPLTAEAAQQIEEALVLICKAHPEVNGGFLVNMALDNIRAARAQEQAEQEPVAFEVGGWYKQQNGKWVQFVEVANAGNSNESMCCKNGIHRYTKRDFGRVTGTAHDYSYPHNTPPLYAAPVRQAEQEPVEKEIAAAVLDHCYGYSAVNDDMIERTSVVVKKILDKHAAPQPVRTKDLTDEEIWEAYSTVTIPVSTPKIARAVIAKFKEKNK